MTSDETQPVKQSRRGWTVQEVAVLRSKASLGADTIATLLGRTVTAVRLQAHRQRVSLRRTTTGRLLGDPTDPQLRDRMRTDPTYATTLNQTARTAHTLPLCPSCCSRPQHSTALGLCKPCHLTALAEAHRLAADTAEARRGLAQARQAKHRAITGDYT